jgi:hypothetical protein
VPPERTIINIHGILANSVKLKLKGSGILIWGDGWKRPATRVYKLNIDAAFDANIGRGSTGAIIIDFGGNFVVASCEASALLVGLQLVKQFGA